MAIRVIDDACVLAGNQATVIIEGADPEVVSSTFAKQEVLKKAITMGLSRAGISGQGGSYPVDGEGNEVTDLSDGVAPGIKYRNDFQVTAGI